MITDTLGAFIVAGVLMTHPEQPTEPLEQVMCVAEAIYFEARGESIAGQYALAHSIRNRLNNPRFKDTYCDVIRHPRHFSYLNAGQPKVRINNPTDALSLEWAVKIAIDLVNDTLGADFTFGADHYFNPYKANPSWQHYGEVVAQIDNHKFLRNVRNR